jgi:hypothetical protein
MRCSGSHDGVVAHGLLSGVKVNAARQSLAEAATMLLRERLGGLRDGVLLIAADDLPDTLLALEPSADATVEVDRVLPGAAGQALAGLERRYGAGVVLDALTEMSMIEGTQLLARLRDQLCRRVYVISADDGARQRGDMLALGYTLRKRSPCGGWLLFDHDVETYNPERDWNTPQHWAHPERFDRERW